MRSKNFINKKIIIVGGGRWAQVYLNYLISIEVKEILIITNYNFNKIKRKYSSVNNLKINKKIYKSIITNYSHVIISSSYQKRKRIINKFLNEKINILVEKPFLFGLSYLNKVIKSQNLNKKNFIISAPWYFNKNLDKIYNNINKNFNNKILKITWYENNKKLIVDRKLKYSYDSISHIISIIIKLFSIKNYNFELSKIYGTNKKEEKYLVKFNQIQVFVTFNMYKKKRTRVIKSNNFSISFLNNSITYINSNKRRIVYNDSNDDLRTQILFFLDNKKINKKILNLIADLSYKIYGL